MTTIPRAAAARSPWRRRLSLAQDAALVVASAVFFYVQAREVLSGSFTNIPFAAEQGLLVGIFLARRRSAATSGRLIDWVAAAGSWLTVGMRPHAGAGAADAAGLLMQMTGLALTCTSFLYLGRSFGVVAANRGLKTAGPYRLVRHPIYLSHFITASGFLVANFWWVNAVLLATVVACQFVRMEAEERVLTETGDYAAYRARVRWRLLPRVY